MSYFPEDIPFMSKEELRENGIRIPKDAADTNVGDTISRQATIDAVNNAFDRETLLTGLVRSIALRVIRDMPSVQPETKEGKWEQVSAQKYFTSASYFYRCSVCGENNPRNTKYCPNCGAKMTISTK